MTLNILIISVFLIGKDDVIDEFEIDERHMRRGTAFPTRLHVRPAKT